MNRILLNRYHFLGKLSRRHSIIILQKISFDISRKLSAQETKYIYCKNLFCVNDNNKYFKMSSTAIFYPSCSALNSVMELELQGKLYLKNPHKVTLYESNPLCLLILPLLKHLQLRFDKNLNSFSNFIAICFFF